jgi:hypothetical protein
LLSEVLFFDNLVILNILPNSMGFDLCTVEWSDRPEESLQNNSR